MKRRAFIKTLCGGFGALFLPVKVFGSERKDDLETLDWTCTGGGQSMELKFPKYLPRSPSPPVRVYHAGFGWVELLEGESISFDGPSGHTCLSRNPTGISCDTTWS